MAAWCGDESRDDTDEIVVHIAWVAKRVRGGAHDGGHELIGLLEGGFLDVKSVRGNSGEGGIVEDNDGVGVFG